MAIASLSAYLQPEIAEPEALENGDADWDDDFAKLIDDEHEGVSAEPVISSDLLTSDVPNIDEINTLAQAQLPSPDMEIDDVLEGLVRPRRLTSRDTIKTAEEVILEPGFAIDPVLGADVSTILKSAADRLVTGIDFVTTGNAE